MSMKQPGRDQLLKEVQRLRKQLKVYEKRDAAYRDAEALVKKHLKAMEISSDGMALLNKQDKVDYLNRALARMLGYKRREELLGKSWITLYGRAGIKGMLQRIKALLVEQGRWSGEVSSKRRDDKIFYHELSLTQLKDGSSVLIARDIKEKKRVNWLYRNQRPF
ncbi:MAG: hypothetical protein BV458_14325 [Thermoplasmata archaeon M9B2D]|nr:MAG: hypothetical protein BV458_14325 [Thermoplasmata archaeon M9B2D]